MLEQAKQYILDVWSDPRIQASIVAAGSVLAAYLIEFIIRRTLVVMASRTKTQVDDEIIAALRRPIFLSVILAGLAWAGSIVVPLDARPLVYSLLKTIAILVWTIAAFNVTSSLLTVLSGRGLKESVFQPRTLPVFDMLVKILVISGAVYFAFLAWDIDVTAWLASAGIVGIAVGFAAKDTLANLFSGIFIIADAPYKVGDFIVLDAADLRGAVTKIGMRSTRILTLDGVEITVPNAIIGNDKIINEYGGPDMRQRVRVTVEVAYGSDIDLAEKVLLGCGDVEGVCETPEPSVRFRAFGASGLEFQLLVWILDAASREKIVHRLNCKVYKELGKAGLEIPYSKHDVFIKELPRLEMPRLARRPDSDDGHGSDDTRETDEVDKAAASRDMLAGAGQAGADQAVGADNAADAAQPTGADRLPGAAAPSGKLPAPAAERPLKPAKKPRTNS